MSITLVDPELLAGTVILKPEAIQKIMSLIQQLIDEEKANRAILQSKMQTLTTAMQTRPIPTKEEAKIKFDEALARNDYAEVANYAMFLYDPPVSEPRPK